MTRDDLRIVLFDYLDRLSVAGFDIDDEVDVDGATEDFLSELEDEGAFDSLYSDE